MSNINNLKMNLKTSYEENDYTKSLSIAESIVELHDVNSKNYEYFMDLYNLAFLQQKLYKYLLAIKGFKKIIKSIDNEFYNQRPKIILPNFNTKSSEDTKETKTKIKREDKKEIDMLKLVINSYNSLGLCYSKNSTKVDMAIAYFEKALHLSEVVLAKKGYPDENLTCMILHNMGCLNYDLENFNKAIEFHERAKNLKNINNTNSIDVLNFLSYSYESLGELDLAIENSYKALCLIKQLEGIDSNEYLSNLYNLSKLYQKNAQYELALKNYEKIYNLLSKLNSAQESDEIVFYLIETLNKLGDCHVHLKNYEDAIRIQQKASPLIKMIVGETHIYYSSNLKKIAEIYYILKDYKNALILYKSENLIKKELYGLYNKEYIKSVLNLINLYIILDDKENIEILVDYLLSSINFD